MALAVDEANNALIIRAPERLFLEVSELVRQIDKNATQTTQVFSIRGLNPAYVRGALQELLGKQSSSASNSTNQPAEAQPDQRQPQP